MTEAEVEAAFVRYLLERGWGVTTDNADYTDVLAHRGSEHIVAEVKGHTSSRGLDVDTLYGQLLRRMTAPGDTTRYALVVPMSMQTKVERVPATVRDLLDIDVWLVDDDGEVYSPGSVGTHS